jgi:hypothetical protein
VKLLAVACHEAAKIQALLHICCVMYMEFLCCKTRHHVQQIHGLKEAHCSES